MNMKVFILPLLGFAAVTSVAAKSVDAQTPKCIDINAATEKELTHSYKGFGKRRAQAIVKYRSEHGDFTSANDLAHIKSIGPTFVKKNLANLEKNYCFKNTN